MIAFSGVRSSWISWRSESAGNCVPNTPAGASSAALRAISSGRGRRAVPR
jgi:hypothetical protein